MVSPCEMRLQGVGVLKLQHLWLTALVGENHGKTKGFEDVSGLAHFWTHRVTQSGHLTVATFGSVETYRNIKMSAMEHPHQYPCSHMVAFPVRKLVVYL